MLRGPGGIGADGRAALQGLAIITVFKAGLVGSARFGSGVVVARLADGSWSAPSAIGTAGAGFGGQIGFELIDFVFILNEASAVRTFAQTGSVTLGGNVSIAAGPMGRSVEASGAASLKSVAGIFSYSKTKGFFAGVSLEGSILVERRDANEKLYNRRVAARALLSGEVPVPAAADPLISVLNSSVFRSAGATARQTNVAYNDIPIYDDAYEDVVWQQGQAPPAHVEPVRSPASSAPRAATWAEDAKDRAHARAERADPFSSLSPIDGRQPRRSTFAADRAEDDWLFDKPKPKPPPVPKPIFAQKTVGPGQAIAKFTFDPDQAGDLGFKKGEVITILKRTQNTADWWTGRIGDREGIFPRYVLLPLPQPAQEVVMTDSYQQLCEGGVMV